jgi:hypothetical protein
VSTTAKPKVEVGQEWEKTGPERTVTRIRILEAPGGSRVQVGTVADKGRVIRKRSLLVSALTNTPKGWRLVKGSGQ